MSGSTYDARACGALCRACPRKGQTPVPPSGRPGARVAWVGQEPNIQEVRSAAVLGGPAGVRLTKMWEYACQQAGQDIPRKDIWVTNAVLCPAVTPSEKEARVAADCCRPRLEREVAQLKPNAGILLMGKWAAYSVLGSEKGIAKLMGFHVRRKSLLKRWAMPVLHPGYTFAQPAGLGPLQAHLEGFVRRMVNGLPPKPALYANPSAEDLRGLIAECKHRGLAFSIDVEARPPERGPREWALLPQWARLRSIGAGADIGSGVGMSWMYPCSREVLTLLKEAVRDPKLVKLYMNGWQYDIPLLERYGFEHRGVIHDIKQGRRALSSTSKLGLAAQAGFYLDCGPWKAEATHDYDDEGGDDMKGLLVDASRIPRKKLLLYNAEDTVRAAQIRTNHIREMRADKTDKARVLRLYQQQLRLARHASAQMFLHGFPIDEQRRRSLSKELLGLSRERSSELARALRPFAKVKVLEPGEKGDKFKGMFRISLSGGVNENDLRGLLFHECARKGIKSFELEVPLSDKCRTDTGQAAVNKRALLYLMAAGNVPEEAKRIIRLAWMVDAPLKARSTYVESDKVLSAIGPDGRVHASHNSDGTETGRFTCSKPNLYNLSEQKKAEEGALGGDLPNIRDMYVAPPGYRIIHRDFSQLELEVMADVTEDQLLRRMLSTGDAHTARVHEWFGIPHGQPVPKMLRRQGKVVGFNAQYGGGAESVYLSVLEQIPEADFEDIAALHATFAEKHVGIREHWESTVAFAETHGYQYTRIMDRRIYYPPGFPLKPTETSNYPIQGTAADIANCSMVGKEEADFAQSMLGRLKKYFPKAWLAMHTYDSFDIIAPKAEAEAIDKMMDECMSGPWRIGKQHRRYRSDGKIGQRWSEV